VLEHLDILLNNPDRRNSLIIQVLWRVKKGAEEENIAFWVKAFQEQASDCSQLPLRNPVILVALVVELIESDVSEHMPLLGFEVHEKPSAVVWVWANQASHVPKSQEIPVYASESMVDGSVLSVVMDLTWDPRRLIFPSRLRLWFSFCKVWRRPKDPFRVFRTYYWV